MPSASKGDWLGTLMTPAGRLHMAVHFAKNHEGIYVGTFDSLDQGARGIPLSAIKATKDSLSFSVAMIRGTYTGIWNAAAQAWIGNWTQGSISLPLNMVGGEAPPAAVVRGLDGEWDGVLDASGVKLRLVFHVKTSPEGGTLASMDSIDQNARALPVQSIRRAGSKVTLALDPALGAEFDGTLSPNGESIAGTWSQNGRNLPLTLTRRAPGQKEPVLFRPQTPTGSVPYRAEDVVYDNSAAPDVRLAGTLTLPEGRGPFPAVLLIAGSGPNDRDEEIFGHKPFLVLADHLTRQGIAVLRYDKRGVGQSSGDYAAATSNDFAADADAGVLYLRKRPEIDPRRIGLVGHSEGGIIAPMVAEKDPAVAFLVLMAAPAVRGDQIIMAQTRALAAAAGAPGSLLTANAAIERQYLDAVMSAKDGESAEHTARQILKKLGMPEAAIAAQAKDAGSDWYRFFLNYDPAPALAYLRQPVLAIIGSKDLQVTPDENLPALKEALKSSRDSEVVELPGLNHLFQTAKTGALSEYGEIEETISPRALDLITRWISSRAAKR